MEVNPREFSREWETCWNSHDLERLLRHFHDDVTFTSPLAAQLIEGSDGIVRGKDALRAYWTEGLRRSPGLKFVVEDVFFGIDTIVIQFLDQKGARKIEVLTFAGKRVQAGHGTCPVPLNSH